MRVIILTAIPFWHPGTQELINQLRIRGITVTALDIFHGKMIDEENLEVNLIPFGLKGFFSKAYMKLFRTSFTKKHTNQSDIIDIHFIEPAYTKHVINLPQKIMCSLFGSDLFRTTELQKKQQSKLFQICDAIVLSKNMTTYFAEKFPNCESKFIINQYGSERIDKIIRLKISKNKEQLLNHFGFPKDKKIISCGYNAKVQQQHIKLLTYLNTLPSKYKESIFLVVPMTYGVEDETYVAEVKELVNSIGVEGVVLEKKMTDEELVKFRLVTDISINTQTTDAMASSIKEAFVAGDIVMVGEWLPYEVYSDLGVYYQTITFDNLLEKVMLSLDNFESFHEKSERNGDIIQNFASWNVLIDKWVIEYKRVYNEGK